MEREALTLDNLAVATAAHNAGGIVIAQVERLADAEALSPRQVEVPGILVDYVVAAAAEDHKQTWATTYSPAFAGEVRVDLGDIEAMPLDARKIIARRAALELPRNGVVNLGIGMPEGVSRVAGEEGILDHITLTAEPGVIGGMPQGGLDFGAAVNHQCLLQQNQQFDFYDGGGLDLAVLGMAQVDAKGHVNVSKFGTKLAGVGGFVNISQSARRLVFTGTFTASGLKTSVSDGALHIEVEGRVGKFTEAVEQITFNGAIAAARGQQVLYVTERCVLELTPTGLRLAEIAPGVDIERDILALLPFDILVERPVLMDARIFRPEPMHLAHDLGIDAPSGKGSVVQLQMHAKRRAKRRTSEPAHHDSIAVANG